MEAGGNEIGLIGEDKADAHHGISDEIEMMEVAEELIGEDVGTTGIDLDVQNEIVYEEVIQEEPCIEITADEESAIIIEGDNDKENTESDAGENEFQEDSEAFMEITRRRISQDREGNCYW